MLNPVPLEPDGPAADPREGRGLLWPSALLTLEIAAKELVREFNQGGHSCPVFFACGPSSFILVHSGVLNLELFFNRGGKFLDGNQ